MIHRRELDIGPISIQYQRRVSEPLGRFGGGWNWSIGLQIGGRTAIVNLLVCMVRISWKQKAKYER